MFEECDWGGGERGGHSVAESMLVFLICIRC